MSRIKDMRLAGNQYVAIMGSDVDTPPASHGPIGCLSNDGNLHGHIPHPHGEVTSYSGRTRKAITSIAPDYVYRQKTVFDSYIRAAQFQAVFRRKRLGR